ncbi:MAG: phosphate acyltransferase [Thiotrichales bacterium]|nr:MAG: phosphate acyltransferase [Thiotrichales bacterium]
MQALRAHPNLNLILVGQQDAISAELSKHSKATCERLSIVHASESVAMDESPVNALKNKRDSSMRVALNLIKSGVAGACVSSGNTGALMATARYVLKMIKGVSRPAIVRSLPSQHSGSVLMLDLGASVTAEAEHLLQFAVMGSVLATTSSCPNPKVALLNVGAEVIKGHDTVRFADRLLMESKQINYVGFVEGDDIFLGDIDVVVCDGFVGNIALKSVEGLAKMLLGSAKELFQSSIYSKMAAMLSKPILTELAQRYNPDNYNGASLLGVQGIVVKSHGGARAMAFNQAITVALHEIEQNVPEKIAASMDAPLDTDDIDLL